MDSLEKTDKSSANQILLKSNGKADSIIYAKFLSRDTQKTFVYWKLGRFITANHGKPCRNNGCNGILSRKHVCTCTDAQAILRNQFPNLDINSEISIVDQAMKSLIFEKNNLLKITLLEVVISEIKLFCL